MWDLNILSRIYQFPQKELIVTQDSDVCKQLISLFILFNESMAQKECIKDPQTGYIKGNFEASTIFLRKEEHFHWFPSYSCAILCYQNKKMFTGCFAVQILGIDNHSFFVHTGKKSYNTNSRASGYVLLPIGTVLGEAGISTLFRKFKALQSRTANDNQGDQKTPAMIEALLRQALHCRCDGVCACNEVSPRGGFTDVGRHKGGQLRDTCFALVRSIHQWSLDQHATTKSFICKPSFLAVTVHFHEWILQKSTEKLTAINNAKVNFTKRDGEINALFCILQRAACDASVLADHRYNMDVYYENLSQVRAKIDRVIEVWDKQEAKRYALVDNKDNPIEMSAQGCPKVVAPPLILVSRSSTVSPTELRKLVNNNLGILSNIIICNDPIDSVASWANDMKDLCRNDSTATLYFLRRIETSVWGLSDTYFHAQSINESKIKTVMDLVDVYRSVLHNFLTSNHESVTVLKVYLQSIEVLVVWVSYCLTFNSVSKTHPDIMTGFGVAIRITDLQHLVLQDKRHRDVMNHVVLFLHKNYVDRHEIFSLRRNISWDSATFEMGCKYSEVHFESIWNLEVADANKRIDLHWAEVQRKQQLARDLRYELAQVQRDHSSAVTICNMSEREHSMCFNRSLKRNLYYTWQRHVDEVNRLTNRMTDLRRQIVDAEEAPAPVIQPLPNDRKKAMKVLFFLYMPVEYRVLSRLTFTAQQLLVPYPWINDCGGKDGTSRCDVFELIKEVQLIKQWVSHYNTYQKLYMYHNSNQRHGNQYDVQLMMETNNNVPKQVGPTHIDRFVSKNQGIWYPDGCGMRMSWIGGCHNWDMHPSGQQFNPFSIESIITASYFAFKLPKSCVNLQWCLHQEVLSKNIHPSRGNRSYALQNMRPEWLSKEGYLDYASLRSYPHLELRKLCDILLKQTLPLDHTAVRLLIKQVLYHVGEIGFCNNNCKLKWRQDFKDVVDACYHLLRRLASELKERPCNFEACQLIGEMSCYFSSYSPCKFKDIGRELANAAIEWAESYESAIAETSPGEICSLRSKQVLYSYTSVLCVVLGNIEEGDAKVILKAIVAACNFFVEDDCDSTKRIELKAICEYLLSFQMSTYLDILKKRSYILTDAVKGIIESCPPILNWYILDKSICFEAIGAENYYSINPLTGIVLINGLPPCHLPASISESELYKRVFGSRKFEVIIKGRVYETVRRIEGCFYRFFQEGNDLVIQESSNDTCNADCWEDMLELLDTKSIDKWGSDLPIRLRVMYSHWLSRKQSMLLFRVCNYKDRKPLYILSDRCRKTPLYDQEKNWRNLINNLGSMDHLIKHQSPYLKVLERVEQRDLMHTYVQSNGNYIQVLYRFGLTFEFKAEGRSFVCKEIVGYKLADIQHLQGTLHGLQTYLVLNAMKDYDASIVNTKILVPLGEIVIDKDGCTKIKTSDIVDEKRKFYIYDMHPRFQHLVAHSICARLHLAGIHVATSCCIPDLSLNRTGEERAIELLRECWVNRPLSTEESNRLNNLKSLCVRSNAALHLLCIELERSANQFSFLHKNSIVNLVQIDSDEAIVYCKNRSRQEASPRMQLSDMEEYRTIGMVTQPLPNTEVHTITDLIECEACPCTDNCVEIIYKLLFEAWEETTTSSSNINSDSCSDIFPFPKSNKTFLENEVFDELSKSWELYCDTRLRHEDFSKSFNTDKENFLCNLESKISWLLELTEKYLKSVLGGKTLSQQDHLYNQGIRLKKLVNVIPTVTRRDLASLACFPESLMSFNPLLSTRSQDRISKAIMKWLELCVLEDKIMALKSHLSREDNESLLKELKNVRNWSVTKYPYWLVFEMEQKIRIREEQYKVAQHLIDHPGDIVQLNMGLGKTRVILPMMVLHYSFIQDIKTFIPRLHILSPLFNEAYATLHGFLCASVLNRKIFCLPFNRGIELTCNQTDSIKDMIEYCQHERGFFIVTPEARLSLELKSKELHMSQNSECNLELSKSLHSISTANWHDVFDEVDEILHHRYQLIYSFGDVSMLPQGKHRWEAFQSLLQIILDTSIPGVTIRPSCNSKEIGYPQIIVDKDCDKTKFRKVIVNKLTSDPPSTHQWIKTIQCNQNSIDIIKSITRVLTDPTADPKSLYLTDEHLYDVLALRGFLAHDILIHCLLKRNRVDYGVKIGGKKRLAVPFRAADTPSERSEFLHPDCAIALSILAYYNDGLMKSQLMEAINNLLMLGDNAKQKIYNEWFNESLSHMSEKEAYSINRIEKIDLSNKVQFIVLCKFFCKNTRAINFWLSSCVLPYELDLYPQRLTANSWNLAHNKNGRVTGFSGTNDNHHILPLQAKQYLPWDTEEEIWKELLATNGKMLDTIILNTLKVEEVPTKNNKNKALIEYIRNTMTKKDPIHALIDSGALLAGQTNAEVANELLNILPDNILGVTYFDNVTQNGEWMILEKSGRCLPKNHSPVDERDAFALFDEPRCRGTDLKLKPKAIAIQTLGRGMQKDKLMQGAGRMRKLQGGQQLIIVANSEVYNELHTLALTQEVNTKHGIISLFMERIRPNVTTKHVLSWVMQNTIESTWKGLANWSDQGLFFATNSGPEHALLNEKNDLESFYGSTMGKIPLDTLASILQDFHVDRVSGKNNIMSDERKKMCDCIVNQCKLLGHSYSIMKTGADEECERELELEIEKIIEKEEEEPQMKAVNEVDWDYKSVFQAPSTKSIISCQPIPLCEMISARLSVKSLGSLSWSKSIYCTRNFVNTVLNSNYQEVCNLDSFLKIIDIMIHFPNGDYLVVSEREADNILLEFWKRRDSGYIPKGLFLCHRSFECEQDLKLSSLLRIGSSTNKTINDIVACSLQLFAGVTNFRSNSRKGALKNILSSTKKSTSTDTCSVLEASGQPEKLVQMRGNIASFHMSDLEQVCIQLACEVEANAMSC